MIAQVCDGIPNEGSISDEQATNIVICINTEYNYIFRLISSQFFARNGIFLASKLHEELPSAAYIKYRV